MENHNPKQTIVICSNSGCFSSGGVEVFITFFDLVYNHDLLREQYEVKKGGCHGFCEVGPTAIIGEKRVFYIRLNENKVKKIVQEHLIEGRVVEQYLYYDQNEKKKIVCYHDIPFIKNQTRLLLKDSPFSDPESFADYQSSQGFKALKKAITTYEPLAICDLISQAKLRGRGGGGFLTGLKWKLFAEQIAQPKYVICNGDEGDPGTFMDRSLLEGDPYRILEGMIIAGYATMATNGIIYLRKEYDMAIQRLTLAIDELYQNKILGPSILDQSFSFDIKIEIGPGAYICGEETSLISSIESRRATPRVKPPYPYEKGLFNNPTLINNVETFANIIDIMNLGAEAYSRIGTESSTGTKIFALSGAIRYSGLVEVPFGKTFSQIIDQIGGSVAGKSKLKAIQIGGESGSIIPAALIDEEITFENLKTINSSIGAGGIVVLDENTCLVEIARYYTEFAQEESCGFCVPCREGTQKIINILDRIIEGKGEIDDIDKIRNIAIVMFETSMCGLGREATNPVMSLIKFFEEELDEHIVNKKCRAGVCAKLVKYRVNAEKCIGCTACNRVCPVEAVKGVKDQVHTIDGEICIRCGECYKVCPVQAINRG